MTNGYSNESLDSRDSRISLATYLEEEGQKYQTIQDQEGIETAHQLLNEEAKELINFMEASFKTTTKLHY